MTAEPKKCCHHCEHRSIFRDIEESSSGLPLKVVYRCFRGAMWVGPDYTCEAYTPRTSANSYGEAEGWIRKGRPSEN